MKRLVTYPLETGGSITVEVDDAPDVARRGGLTPSDVTEKVSSSFESALQVVKPAILAIATTFRNFADAPEEVEVEFGLKFSGQAGAFIASAGTEAQFLMKMVWRRARLD